MTARDKYCCWLPSRFGLNGTSRYNRWLQKYTQVWKVGSKDSILEDCREACLDHGEIPRGMWDFFHAACYMGDLEFIKTLLTIPRLGVNNAKNNLHQTLLLSALHENQTEIVLFLLQDPRVNIHKCGGALRWLTPFSVAIDKDNQTIIDAFLAIPTFNVNQLSKLYRPTELQRYLDSDNHIDSDDDINPYAPRSSDKKFSALEIAVMNKHRETIVKLLSRDDIDLRIDDTYVYAFVQDTKDIFEMLCKKSPISDETLMRCFNYACHEVSGKGRSQHFEYLITHFPTRSLSEKHESSAYDIVSHCFLIGLYDQCDTYLKTVELNNKDTEELGDFLKNNANADSLRIEIPGIREDFWDFDGEQEAYNMQVIPVCQERKKILYLIQYRLFTDYMKHVSALSEIRLFKKYLPNDVVHSILKMSSPRYPKVLTQKLVWSREWREACLGTMEI